jgi:hypothetical protein
MQSNAMRASELSPTPSPRSPDGCVTGCWPYKDADCGLIYNQKEVGRFQERRR